jgi:threonine/homoserine/homoserine lactone efflux protein
MARGSSVTSGALGGIVVPFELWIAFVATSAVILIIPGPTILTVVSYSLAHGRQAYFPILVAVALGDSTAIILSLLGLGALLATSAALFAVIKLVGGLYLIYLGIKLLGARVTPSDVTNVTPMLSGWQLLARMYPVAFLNPKGIVFYVAFFPQFISPNANVPGQLSLLALTFIALGVVNVTFYSLFAASSRRMLSTPKARRGFNILGGSLLSTAGIYALLARKPV